MSQIAAEHTVAAARRWTELKAQYRKMKRAKTAEMQAQLAELRLQVKHARREFVLVFDRYRTLVRGFMRMAEA